MCLTPRSTQLHVKTQGVVVFFPSFGYAEEVHVRWAASGDLARLASRKRVFREPRSAADVEATLREYGEAADPPGGGSGGALLLCVVGGKMSEGINFGDGLGRFAFPDPY